MILPMPGKSPNRYKVSHLLPRAAIGELSHTVDCLVSGRREEESDSPSSGVGSLRQGLEEELGRGLQEERRRGRERLEQERVQHREQVQAMEREVEMERRNSLLRLQHLQEERDRLKQRVEQLEEQCSQVVAEKDQWEGRVGELLEERRCRSPVTAVEESVEEQR